MQASEKKEEVTKRYISLICLPRMEVTKFVIGVIPQTYKYTVKILGNQFKCLDYAGSGVSGTEKVGGLPGTGGMGKTRSVRVVH